MSVASVLNQPALPMANLLRVICEGVAVGEVALTDLKTRMKRAGLSYRAAAMELGTHASYLSDILNARRGHPGYAIRNRLAVLLEGMN